MSNSKIFKKQLGFSLIELSIVLVIVGLLTSGIVSGLTTYIKQTRQNKAIENLNIIKEALVGFAAVNGRLPCPDTDNDGLEDGGPGVGNYNCNGNPTGNLPFATLGVNVNIDDTGRAADIWGQPLIYRVAIIFADDPVRPDNAGCTNRPLSNSSIWLCSDGNIIIEDPLFPVAGNNIATDIPVVIVSTGANQGNDPTPGNPQSATEAENLDNDLTFVRTTISSANGAEFDDIVVWLSPNVLKNRLIAVGQLP